jgi:hypothetical protein
MDKYFSDFVSHLTSNKGHSMVELSFKNNSDMPAMCKAHEFHPSTTKQNANKPSKNNYETVNCLKKITKYSHKITVFIVTIRIRMEIPYKAKNKITIRSCCTTFGHIPKGK